MERIKNLFAWSLSFAIFFLLASTAQAQIAVGDYTISGSAEVGGVPGHVSSERGGKAKFEEYRDVPESVVVPELQFMIGGKKEDFYLNFDASKAGLNDQSYMLRFGRYGLLDVQFEWDQIPHIFNKDTAMTPYASSNNGGTLTLGTNRPTSFATTNVCGTNGICTWLEGAANPVDLNLYNGIARFKLRYTPTPGWTFTGNYWSNNQEGKRAFGALNGYASATMNINEVPEPISYQNHNLELGGEYAGNGWSLGLKYNASLFHNNVSTLVWDNPVHKLAAGACQDSATYTPTTGTGPCQGRLDLYPDNQAHTFTLTGTAALPLKTRFFGTASYGWRLQNDSFLPFTINSCFGSGAVPASCEDGARTALPSISEKSLHGDVRPLMINLALANNSLINRLNLKAYYRFYDLNNYSSLVRTPSGVVGNDTNRSVDENLDARPSLHGYSKNTVGLEAGYDITRWLAGKVNYTYERMHRDGGEIFNSDSSTIGPTLDIKPTSWILLRANYKYSRRNASHYNNTTQEFFEAERGQNKGSLFANVAPWDKLSFHGGMELTENTYPNAKYGVQDDFNYSPSIGVLYTPLEWLRLFGDYNWDWNKWRLTTSAQWTAKGKDLVNTFSLGSDMDLIKNLLGFRIQYSFSQALSEINNHGGSAPATSDYPNLTNTWHELLARFEYKMHKNVALRFGYYFNKLREKDYGVDIMKPWMGDVADPNATAAQTSSQQRSIFLGDQMKGPYTAHIGFVTLRFSF